MSFLLCTFLCLAIFSFEAYSSSYIQHKPGESQFNLSLECYSEDPSPSFLNSLSALQELEGKDDGLEVMRRNENKMILVDTHFHIVTTEDQAQSVPDKMIDRQYSILNELYAPYGIQFLLHSTTFTINDTWALNNDDVAMKSALRRGSYSSLNLYFQSNLSRPSFMAKHPESEPTTVLGFSSLPDNLNSSGYSLDGCNVHAGSMPGGHVLGNNLGKTAIHEVGHWFGLLHTFEGYSCEGDGDFVDDTPQQSTSTAGCPSGKNSCPGLPGMDMVSNYMDYSTDQCYNLFTRGQWRRMFNLFAKFRQDR